MTFQPRMLTDGRVCCSSAAALCDTCREHHGISDQEYLDYQARHFAAHIVQEDDMKDDFITPDPYAAGITAMRAAAATSLSRFEDAQKASRLRAIEVEAANIAATNGKAYRALADDDLSAYKPPDIYAEPLRRMKIPLAAHEG